jgi:hypothetical protein
MLQRVLSLYRSLRNGEKAVVLLSAVLLLSALIGLIVNLGTQEESNWEAVFSGIAAIAAVAAAFIAGWSIRAQNRRAQLTLSVDLTRQLVDTYESQEMRATRQAATEFLLPATTADGRLMLNKIDRPEAKDLIATLNFFEDIGTLVRRDAIEEHFVWNTFFPTVPMYWRAAELLVEHWRMVVKRPIIYKDLEYLSARLTNYENKQLARFNLPPKGPPSWQEVRGFLQGETQTT